MVGVRMVLRLAALLVLLCAVPDVQYMAQAVQVIGEGENQEIVDVQDPTTPPPETSDVSADNRTAEDPGDSANGTSAMQSVIARNRALDDLFSDGGTLDMWMVLLCHGFQNTVPACRGVQRFESFFNNLVNQRVRRKRSWFGSSTGWNTGSWNTFNNDPWRGSLFDPWPNTVNPDPWPRPADPWPSSGLGFTNTAVICPSVTNQSAVYNLSPNSAAYPAGDIGTEIVQPANAAIRACLLMEMVLPTDPPQIIVEPFRLTANATCPFTQLRLWSYTSQAINDLCWIIQTFQEIVIYTECTSRFCVNCKDKNTKGVNPFSQKLCIPEYRTVSVWAYCPSLLQGTRIIRDRLIIPISCTCQSIQCEAIQNW